LLRRLVLRDRIEQLLAGEDQAVNQHPGLVALGYAVAAFVDFFQWAVIGVFCHDSDIHDNFREPACRRLFELEAMIGDRFDFMP
jgi:hypothetical protein